MPDGTISTRPEPPEREPADWIEEEFGSAALGDKRLVERLMQLGESFFGMPTANIPQACATKAAVKAAYRFFDNDQISMDVILAPHFEATEQRVSKHEVVLVVQDTNRRKGKHQMAQELSRRVRSSGQVSRHTQLIVMAEREADIHELFAEHLHIRKSAELLIRAEKSRNRNVSEDEEQIQRLWPYMDAIKPAGIVEVVVPPPGSSQASGKLSGD